MPKFTKEDILKYYDILGIDKEKDGLVIKDSINLGYITDLYELNEFNSDITSLKDLSDAYGILLQMIKDGFWYTTKVRREDAYRSAMEVIEDLTKFKIAEEDRFDRINNLKSTIIKGLCESGDIISFRLYQKNSSLNYIANKINELESENRRIDREGLDEEKYPEDLIKLYYLVGLSKYNDTGCDDEMFDGIGKVSLMNLRRLFRRNTFENVPENETEEREKMENPKILRLSRFQKKKD